MQSMTLEQLRAASDAGGVSNVILKGQGGAFLVQIATRSGVAAVLAKARSSEPRRFNNPLVALSVLRDIGITNGQFDAREWNPEMKETPSSSHSQAEAMHNTHKTAAYSQWLALEIQKSIDDPRLNVPQDEVMARMDARIAQHKKAAAGKRS